MAAFMQGMSFWHPDMQIYIKKLLKLFDFILISVVPPSVSWSCAMVLPLRMAAYHNVIADLMEFRLFLQGKVRQLPEIRRFLDAFADCATIAGQPKYPLSDNANTGNPSCTRSPSSAPASPL
ncbi:MAG TPA: hypothetical protein ENI93_00015 [Gammaproteobacteria bacterium]|nr:hypothetical protein [Gammaproteobacteria bacterium]